jgi:hypothetical protein
VILLASTPKSFRDSWMPYLAFVIFNSWRSNLGKTKVMIFNGSKNVLSEFHFYFRGEETEITTT